MNTKDQQSIHIQEFKAPENLRGKVIRNFHLIETLSDTAKIFTIAPLEYFSDKVDCESR